MTDILLVLVEIWLGLGLVAAALHLYVAFDGVLSHVIMCWGSLIGQGITGRQYTLLALMGSLNHVFGGPIALRSSFGQLHKWNQMKHSRG